MSVKKLLPKKYWLTENGKLLWPLYITRYRPLCMLLLLPFHCICYSSLQLQRKQPLSLSLSLCSAMAVQREFCIILAVMVVVLVVPSNGCSQNGSRGVRYSVGDAFWAIPPIVDYYSKWSSNHFFKIGDSLGIYWDTNIHENIHSYFSFT